MPSLADSDAVKQANLGFYRAFESLDVHRMRAVWAQSEEIACVHPGWPLLTGFEKVMESWKRIFENTSMMHFTITGIAVRIAGETAWVMCTENINTLMDGKVAEAKVQATNVFTRHDGRWLMVHHHGSSLPAGA
jgi:ketosteroid isomerase-like protein